MTEKTIVTVARESLLFDYSKLPDGEEKAYWSACYAFCVSLDGVFQQKTITSEKARDFAEKSIAHINRLVEDSGTDPELTIFSGWTFENKKDVPALTVSSLLKVLNALVAGFDGYKMVNSILHPKENAPVETASAPIPFKMVLPGTKRESAPPDTTSAPPAKP